MANESGAARDRFSLTGKIALVTGAARGLGHDIALALADAGADVALGLRRIDADGGLCAAIAAKGRRALALQMDVTRKLEVESAVHATEQAFGRIDILVNNAGIGPASPAAALITGTTLLIDGGFTAR